MTTGDVARLAAAGLVRRSVRAGDVGGVLVTDDLARTLATQTIIAAGAVPVPLPLDATAGELACLLTDRGARFLLTDEKRAPVALEAIEACYVRQVFTFGDVPGTTSFTELCSPRA